MSGWKVLLVSYYAEAHLPSSAAQNTRLLARSLAAAGHEVRVVCAAESAGSERVDGYRIDRLPLASPAWKRPWLGVFRSDRRVREIARRELRAWRPDVLLIGAWQHLSDYGIEARGQGIPIVQVVHDYSLICLRQWLLDSSGELCAGPTSRDKCVRCLGGSLGIRASLKDRVLSLPAVASLAGSLLGSEYVGNHHVATGAGDALAHMAAFRRAVTLFVAQAPSVVDILGSAGIAPSQCRFLPQFIGDHKLERYPRPARPAGGGRPLRFAYVGRWSREKGPDLLLDAFLAADFGIDAEMWIISGNADVAAIEARGSLDGETARRIRVIDDARGAEVSRRLARCDVCVVPSRCRELASRVVLEAHAQSVPVIASDTVGNSYLIGDRVNGRIFSAGDVAALRRCLEELAAEPSAIREWSLKVASPVRREEWLARVTEILEQAIALG